jgi:hypothetical protein
MAKYIPPDSCLKSLTLVKTKNIITGIHFQLKRNRAGQWWLRCLDRKSATRGRRVSEKDAKYLHECGNEFESACVMDFGIGIYQA